jgi:RNA polymerase sigma-70 factor, ECF subfamily
MRISLQTPDPGAALDDATDDRSLAAAARTDRAAFATLYRRHVTVVYRYALAHAGAVADAEDLTAQVFFEALQSIARYRGEGAFGAWLIGIAKHRVTDHFRRNRDMAPINDELIGFSADGMDELVGRRVQLAQVLAALQTLSPDARESIALRYFAELSFAEVGAAMQRSEAAAKMLVARALAALRSAVQAHEQD